MKNLNSQYTKRKQSVEAYYVVNIQLNMLKLNFIRDNIDIIYMQGLNQEILINPELSHPWNN